MLVTTNKYQECHPDINNTLLYLEKSQYKNCLGTQVLPKSFVNQLSIYAWAEWRSSVAIKVYWSIIKLKKVSKLSMYIAVIYYSKKLTTNVNVKCIKSQNYNYFFSLCHKNFRLIDLLVLSQELCHFKILLPTLFRTHAETN